MDPDQKAQELFDEAEKKLKRQWFVFGPKYDEAQELFTSAGNKWKSTKNWASAGQAFMKASDCHNQLDSKHESASALVEAAQCFKKAFSRDLAITCFQQANEFYIDMGRFTSAAKYEKELGDLAKEESKIDQALLHYKKAADYYSSEDQTSGVNNCLMAAADLCSTGKQYAEAVELYEQIARNCKTKTLLNYHVKDYLFKAMLCSLAMAANKPGGEGVDAAKQQLQRYCNMDVHFGKGRDYELLEKVIEAVETQDLDLLSQAVAEYESVCTLDDWKVTVLHTIQQSMEKAEENLDLC
jgi:alpha-soluble NSF attachment protein|mmetsp:Transcript_27711/g.44289  ORF Transcript_27711/g.44289 Transcript_27711/m.44289 type:complete len:297 (-) Transcript_27711:122-1012(-)